MPEIREDRDHGAEPPMNPKRSAEGDDDEARDVLFIRSVLLILGAGVAFVAVLAWALRAPAPWVAPEQGFELGRVTLVEPGGDRRGPVSLRVEGGRIASIGPPVEGSAVPYADAYVLPGLTDMHAHFPMTRFPGDEEATSLLFLLHGVTAARLIGGASPEAVRGTNEQAEAGLASAPRYFTCGPILDGADPAIPGNRSVATPEQAKVVVAELASRGVDCIKAYDRLDLETLVAMREAAHEHGIRIVGHTPQGLTLEQAHLDDVQHLRGVHPPFQDERLDHPYFLAAWLRLDEERIRHVIEVSHRYGMAYTPTLVAIEGTVRSRPWAAWRESATMQLWLPHLRDAVWSGEVGFNPARFASAATLEMVEKATQRMSSMVGALHRADVPIHTGTDCNVPNVVPGASLHRELELLVKAGLTAEQALEASTRVSARFLGLEGAGQLREGSAADLVIFARDPTREIGSLASLAAVARAGRLYTRSGLEGRLERYRAHYRTLSFDKILMPSLRAALRGATSLVQR